jgi:hypothetical protein
MANIGSVGDRVEWRIEQLEFSGLAQIGGAMIQQTHVIEVLRSA